jgi:hypothetical protein
MKNTILLVLTLLACGCSRSDERLEFLERDIEAIKMSARIMEAHYKERLSELESRNRILNDRLAELKSILRSRRSTVPGESKSPVETLQALKHVKMLLMLDTLQALLSLDDAIIDMEEKIRADSAFKVDLSKSLESRLKERRELRKMYYELDSATSGRDIENCVKKWKLEDRKEELLRKYRNPK